MSKVLIVYVAIELAAVFLAVISILFWDKRYKKNHGTNVPLGFVKTEEVMLDPKTNKKLRVYFNPQTGARFYHEED